VIKHRIFKIAEDGNYEQFAYMMRCCKFLMESFLTLRDESDRTLLHISAYKGNHLILKSLLQAHKDYRVSAFSQDINGNSALELSCIRGYDISPNEKCLEEIATTYLVSKLILLVDPH